MSFRPFLNKDTTAHIAEFAGTPTYVYDARRLASAARTALDMPNAYGLTVRYAMKAAPNAAILRLFRDCGLHIDASSGYEVRRALLAGIPAARISLSAQELPAFFPELIEQGIELNACSLSQIEQYGKTYPGRSIGVRFNPGLGSGSHDKTNVGGRGSSFGIWHEKLSDVKDLAARYGLEIVRVHSHIGSGADPAVWERAADLTLSIAEQFEGVQTVNLGGGFKVARMESEKSTELEDVGEALRARFRAFANEHGRKLHLEIEPGTFLVANAGSLLCRVVDAVDTGAEGRRFLKLDSGMTEILRPALYGSQHPIRVFEREEAATNEHRPTVVVGHCCEAGDLLTPEPGKPEDLGERMLPAAMPGDLCVIDGTGAYCSAMSAKNYNAFPEAAEVLIDFQGNPVLIRQRQTLDQLLVNELDVTLSLP